MPYLLGIFAITSWGWFINPLKNVKPKKMKRKSILYVSVAFLLCAACKQEAKEKKSPSAMQNVMAVHDGIMPKMGTIGKLVAELNAKVDSTEAGIPYEAAKKDLQAAHKAMMDWMRGFGDRFSPDEIMNGKELTEEKQQWLAEEELKIKAVSEQFNTSIEKAEKLLGK